MNLTSGEKEQLHQLRAAGLRGVWAGDLIDKTSTRELIRRGLAENGPRGTGSPSALSTVYISKAGRAALSKAEGAE